MRRIALTIALLAAGIAGLASSAGADDTHTYEIEMYNAFGIVSGSDVRIAGVNAGTVTDLDINAAKRALVTIELSGDLGTLGEDTTCSSEPQSLIAEYFINCEPSGPPLEEDDDTDDPDADIPASQVEQTVQTDLVQNTLREPFKRRLQVLINEFGTALAGNPESLNEAIRLGAPALTQLQEVTEILAEQNAIIRDLNVNSDEVIGRLAERRDDVVRFVEEARDTAEISASRGAELSRNFELLDDFLFELRPVMRELGNLAKAQTPLLVDLRKAAPGLNTLGANLPDFNRATETSLESLGNASEVGQRAVVKSRDEIAELNTASQKAQPAGDLLADFLESLDDPRRAVEEDCDARYDLREQPGEADRRVALLEDRLGEELTGTQNANPGCAVGGGGPIPGAGNPGYTGLEGLLNYGYVQTLSLNLFDQIGHALAIQLVGEGPLSEGGECGEFSPGGPLSPDGQHGGWPKAELFGGGDGSNTRNPEEAAHCVGILGDYQPGISPGTVEGDAPGEPNTGLTQFNPAPGSPSLPPYDPEVCSPPIAKGSTNQGICDPGAPDFDSALSANREAAPQQAQEQQQQPSEEEVDDLLDKLKQKPNLEDDLDRIREQLGLPPGAQLPPEVSEVLGVEPASAGDQTVARDLLDFLFGP